MPDDPAVEPTIRNQRYHGWWTALWVWGCVVFWAAGGLIAKTTVPAEQQADVCPLLPVFALVTFAVMLFASHRGSVARLKLGEALTAYPSRRYAPEVIAAIRFCPDPHEDYAEEPLPVRMAEATVELKSGRQLRLVVSAGDAVRLREWAEGKAIAVFDPHGCSEPPARDEPG